MKDIINSLKDVKSNQVYHYANLEIFGYYGASEQINTSINLGNNNNANVYIVNTAVNFETEVNINIKCTGNNNSVTVKSLNIAGKDSSITNVVGVTINKGTKANSAHVNIKNFLLHNSSVILARPDLYIHTDSVECSHGCSMGYFNADQLFYLNTRGIKNAKELLLQGIINSMLVQSAEADKHIERLIDVQRLIS